MDQIVQLMKETKESWVATGPENTDLAIYLHFWRGDSLDIMVQCPLDRDTGLQAGQVGAAGFGATTMSLTFESFNSTLGESPITGSPWEPHEMQYVFEAVPENRTEHWVKECVTTTAHERGGEFALTSMPYVIEDGQVVWSESRIEISSQAEGEGGGGVMFDWMQHAMAQPTIEEVMSSKAENDQITAVISEMVTDPEMRLFHTDMATYRAMEEQHLVSAIMFAANPGSLRAEMIEERLGAQAIKYGED